MSKSDDNLEQLLHRLNITKKEIYEFVERAINKRVDQAMHRLEQTQSFEDRFKEAMNDKVNSAIGNMTHDYQAGERIREAFAKSIAKKIKFDYDVVIVPVVNEGVPANKDGDTDGSGA